ncbi:nicotinate phosphoribosyltransferase [Magnetococcales bacterium HHB-1]
MIIQSLLDTDLYKLTMMQLIFHRYPMVTTKYRFQCRTQGVDLRPIKKELQQEINNWCQLRFTTDELDYLSTLPYFQEDFLLFLEDYRSKRRFVKIDNSKEQLEIEISGLWLQTILFEVPLLSLVNELYFRQNYLTPDLHEGRIRLQKKIDLIKKHPQGEHFNFSDFGTRRRFSRHWHYEVIQTLSEQLANHNFATSNVALAKQFNLQPVGTMAHEYLQAFQALVPLHRSQHEALKVWTEEYRGHLGIALSDVCGFKAFLNDFDLHLSKLYDGARHDSGNPYTWGEQLIDHYQRQNIDPKQKTLVFSDGLTVVSALKLFDHFRHQSRTAFGIGTHLTNDMGHKALQIVIKMVTCQGQPVAKISDSPGKTVCQDEIYLAWLRQVFRS